MRRTAIILFALLSFVCLLQAGPADGQLLVVDEELFVVQLRPDKNKIGISSGKTGVVTGWVKLDSSTVVYRRSGKPSNQATMWQRLKPGMKIKVHGGGDWDGNLKVKTLWY
ncbi:MAG: hypothetical protein FJX76_16785 [Armatimonadetes bacterium]|nr:hypothetical protein [Armatimonadota bacterium]